MPSTGRDIVPQLPQLPFATTTSLLHPPPSPNTHRSLRKLQSAHNLGARASSNQSSLISQQRLQQRQSYQQLRAIPSKPLSPAHKHAPSDRSPQHDRANSDAASVFKPPMAPIPAAPTPAGPAATAGVGGGGGGPRRSGLGRRSVAADAMSLERLFRDGPPDGDLLGALESTRFKILDQGIRSDSDGMSSLRIYAWLVLLDAPVLDTDSYLQLIHRGASPAYSKIRNDTFRTLTTDPLFRRRVSEASLIRLLNAIAWKLHDAREERQERHVLFGPRPAGTASRQSLPAMQDSPNRSRPSTADRATHSQTSSPVASRGRARAMTLTTETSESSGVSEPGTYVQGMNVLAAPFLYAARSEAEAFVAFHSLLTRECPGYIRGAMDGVHKGLALVDKVLAIFDPKLSQYLTSKNLSAEIYAFPSVLTLCACTPPLPEVLRLWDFLFAYGPHLNILCIVAQLVIIRDQILSSPSPNKLLRSFPALQADQIKKVAISIIGKIPDDVYAEIVNHAQ